MTDIIFVTEKIRDLMVATGVNLIVGVDVHGKWYCHLEDSYISMGWALNGESGRGETFLDAIQDYIETIRGKTLIIHPSGNNRKEIYIM